MKKSLFIAFLLVSIFKSNAQQKETFSFVKSSILNLEKKAKVNDDTMDGRLFSTTILKKRMLGMFLVEDTTSPIDYVTAKYISFLSIPATDKFEMITDANYANTNYEQNLFIQNIKTKQKYAVISFPMRNLQDYSNMSNQANGNGWLTKNCPRELSIEEKTLVAKYKALIKSADANIAVLLSIQKKYITRGYFDAERVNSLDKKLYNKNLDELKIKANKLTDIDRYEDKEDIAQNKLTLSESGSLYNINDWNINQVKLN